MRRIPRSERGPLRCTRDAGLFTEVRTDNRNLLAESKECVMAPFEEEVAGHGGL